MNNEHYELGVNNGYGDEKPMSGFLMSQRTHSYTIGYMAGYAMNVMSMQGGSAIDAANVLGELSWQYNIDIEEIDDHILDEIFENEGGFTDELRSAFDKGFDEKCEELDDEEED